MDEVLLEMNINDLNVIAIGNGFTSAENFKKTKDVSISIVDPKFIDAHKKGFNAKVIASM